MHLSNQMNTEAQRDKRVILRLLCAKYSFHYAVEHVCNENCTHLKEIAECGNSVFSNNKGLFFSERIGSQRELILSFKRSPYFEKGRLNKNHCTRESQAQFENRIKHRVYVRPITHCTMYEKDPFC